jgi:exonuclease III
MATWKVRSLFQPGASRTLENELKRYRVEIAALQEIRWRDIEMTSLNDYVLINSGSRDNILGMGFMIKKSIRNSLLNYKTVTERICVVRLKGSIVSVHVPTEEKEEEVKDAFYEALKKTYDELPRHDVKIMGDLNAKIGKEELFRPTIGGYSKHSESNDNGLRIIDFAIEKGMKVSSTYFPHKETWVAPDGVTRNQKFGRWETCIGHPGCL